MPGKVFVIEASTFMLVPEDTDLQAIAAEHGGDVVGHFPDGEVVGAVVHAVRPATPEELTELVESQSRPHPG